MTKLQLIANAISYNYYQTDRSHIHSLSSQFFWHAFPPPIKEVMDLGFVCLSVTRIITEKKLWIDSDEFWDKWDVSLATDFGRDPDLVADTG